MSDFERSIGRFLRAYKLSSVLIAAVESNLFDALAAEDGDVEAASGRTGIRTEVMNLFLDVLGAARLLKRTDEGVVLSKAAKRYLCTDSDEYCGDIVMYHGYAAPKWLELGAVLRNRKSFSRAEDLKSSPSLLRHYMNALRLISKNVFKQALPAIGAAERDGVIVDMGCGPAEFTASFLVAFPSWKAVLIDLLPLQEEVERTMEQHNVPPGKVIFRQGNLLEGAHFAPGSVDIVYMGHLLHEQSDSGAGKILEIAREYLKPGGLLAVLDFDATRGAIPRLAESLFFLSVFLFCAVPVRPRGVRRIQQLMTKAGLRFKRLLRFKGDLSYETVLFLAGKEVENA